MACNFSQLKRRQSSIKLGMAPRLRHLSEEEQFHTIRSRSRSRSVGRLESGTRDRIDKITKIRNEAQNNYETVHAGVQPEIRRPLKVCFQPPGKAVVKRLNSCGEILSRKGLTSIPDSIGEEEEVEEKDKDAGETKPLREDLPTTKEEDIGEEEVGEAWDSKLTFMLATIGYAVGLGNVWRFPYLAQKNGGGAFLIPYILALFTMGLPLFILELAIGQRLRKGSIGVWKQVSGYLGGLGLASAVVAFNVALYYNTIIAWCSKYLVQSFMYPLPWSSCPEENTTSPENIAECQKAGSTAYFWYRSTLEISSDVETFGEVNWIIALCLMGSWLIVYICMVKGITENPKMVYVTAIFPYLVLVIFFFRAITLPGMGDGVMHLFTPKWEKLLDPMVWLEAGTQIFFSLGLSFGGLIAYSSYNPVNNNCTRDALIVAFTNCSTSVFAAVIIFAIMGFKAHAENDKCLLAREMVLNSSETAGDLWALVQGSNITLPICNLQQQLEKSASGTGLAFILFTEAVNQFPLSNLWSLLFFMMLFTLGLDSQFGTLQCVIQAAADLKLFPNVKKEIQTGVICGTSCLLSMMFANSAGNYVFTIYDNFSANIPLLVIALFQSIGVSYFYGLKRFCDDIEMMTGSRPGLYLCLCWKYISPFIMITILIAFFAKMIFGGVTYEAWDSVSGESVEKDWPWWTYIIIVLLITVSVIWIPLIACLRLCGIKVLSDEKPGWFPADELREDHNIEPHQISKLECILFGMRDNGEEGICCPHQTFPEPPGGDDDVFGPTQL